MDIYRVLPSMDDFAEGDFAPLVAFNIIHEGACKGLWYGSEDMRQALCWLSWQALHGMEKIEQSVSRASDVAGQFRPSDDFGTHEATFA